MIDHVTDLLATEVIIDMRTGQVMQRTKQDGEVNNHLGWNYVFERQYDKALVQFAELIDLQPNFALSYWYRGWVYEAEASTPTRIAI